MLRRLSVSALIIAGAFTLARADVYRWVDDRGQPHYSDQWMPGSEVIKTSKTRPPGTESTARSADRVAVVGGQQAPLRRGARRTSSKIRAELSSFVLCGSFGSPASFVGGNRIGPGVRARCS